MMAEQVEGFVFHFTQLEESNKENCSINCDAAFSTRKSNIWATSQYYNSQNPW